MNNYSLQKWTVKWENGKIQQYVPYDSYGMTTFIKRGLEIGKVTVNDREVIILNEFWTYKDEDGYPRTSE